MKKRLLKQKKCKDRKAVLTCALLLAGFLLAGCGNGTDPGKEIRRLTEKLTEEQIKDSRSGISAPAGKLQENTPYTVENGVITAYDFSEEKALIPARINGEEITAIGKEAFVPDTAEKAGKLLEVELPLSIKEIGEGAFAGNSRLSSVKLGAVEVIRRDAFAGCRRLQDIVIPDSCTALGDRAFDMEAAGEAPRAENNGTLVLGKHLRKIGESGFRNAKFSKVEFRGEEIPLLADGAMELAMIPSFVITGAISPTDLSSLRERLQRSGVNTVVFRTEDGELLTEGAEELYDIDRSGRLTLYTGNENYIEIPEMVGERKVTALGKNIFSRNSELQEVIIPEGVSVIGEEAFLGCENLRRISIPDSVRKIDKSAFEGCISLEQTDLKNVSVLGDRAFYRCRSLKHIRMVGIREMGELVFARTAVEDLSFWPEQLRIIPKGSFEECPELYEIIIPEGVQRIEKSAFSGCGNSEKPENMRFDFGAVPKGYSQWREEEGLPRWSVIRLPESLLYVGPEAFSIRYIDGVYFPDSLTEVRQLPRMDAEVFGRAEDIGQLYFSREVIEKGMTTFDKAFSGVRKAGERCWFDAGSRHFWVPENRKADAEDDGMAAEREGMPEGGAEALYLDLVISEDPETKTESRYSIALQQKGPEEMPTVILYLKEADKDLENYSGRPEDVEMAVFEELLLGAPESLRSRSENEKIPGDGEAAYRMYYRTADGRVVSAKGILDTEEEKAFLEEARKRIRQYLRDHEEELRKYEPFQK